MPQPVRGLNRKSLGLLISLLLLLFTAATVSLFLYAKEVANFDNLVQYQVRAKSEIYQLNVMFKTQVQEWKNLLLRGQDDTQRNKYWQRFLELHEAVQGKTRRLFDIPMDPQSAASLRQFSEVHAALLPQYQAGFQAYLNNGMSANAGDNVVAGIDREPAQLLGNLSAQLNNEVMRVSGYLRNTANTAANILLGLMALICTIVVIASSRVIHVQVIKPLLTNEKDTLLSQARRETEGRQTPVNSGSNIVQLHNAKKKRA